MPRNPEFFLSQESQSYFAAAGIEKCLGFFFFLNFLEFILFHNITVFQFL